MQGKPQVKPSVAISLEKTGISAPKNHSPAITGLPGTLPCTLAEGAELERAIERLFGDPHAAYLHVHFAAPGCYAAKVERA